MVFGTLQLKGESETMERMSHIFFITEFGDSWKSRDLLFELKELGKIVEVVIPNKRDRRGRRYGFAR